MEAHVDFNYEPQEPDELTLKKGDIIKDIKILEGGWWEGTLGDKRGMFPDNFVTVLESNNATNNQTGEGTSNNETVTLRNGSGRKFCKVLFSYEPNNDDELRLVPDDVVEYLGEVEEGWWRGRLKGKHGVFPSNFVSSPAEDVSHNKENEKKELCRVLFPYKAANDDELTVIEGDIITIISKDAPDKGWWKGELKGQIGLFPDNFVEVIPLKNNETQENLNKAFNTAKSTTRNSNVEKKEKAHVRKSLDTKNINVIKNTMSRPDIASKKMTPSATSTTVSVINNITGNGDRKPAMISSLKRYASADSAYSTNNGNGSIGTGLGEELDEIERGEGTPLFHWTALRAKAPRRRLPTTQRLKQQTSTTSITNNHEDNFSNGNSEKVSRSSLKDDDNDLLNEVKKKTPWVEELKSNNLEKKNAEFSGIKRDKKKDVLTRVKDRNSRRLNDLTNNVDGNKKTETDDNDIASRDKIKEKNSEKDKHLSVDLNQQSDHNSVITTTSPTGYVPYQLYSQLLDRVSVLEEKQTVLQKTVNQLSEQLSTVLAAEKN